MRQKFVAAICAVIVAGLSAGLAFAGEVKGPPSGPCGGDGQPICVQNTNDTAAPTHANSACALLNDTDPTAEQTVSQVQTAADSFKYYSGPPLRMLRSP